MVSKGETTDDSETTWLHHACGIPEGRTSHYEISLLCHHWMDSLILLLTAVSLFIKYRCSIVESRKSDLKFGLYCVTLIP